MASLQDIRRRIKSVKSIQQITSAMNMVATSRLRRAKEAANANKPYADKMSELVYDISSHAGNFDHPLMTEHSDGKRLVVVIAADKGLAGAYSSNAFKAALGVIASDGDIQTANGVASIKDDFSASSYGAGGGSSRMKQAKGGKSSSVSTYSASTDSKSDKDDSGGSFDKAVPTSAHKARTQIVAVGKKAKEFFTNRNYDVVQDFVGFSERPKYEDANAIAKYLVSRFKSGEIKEVYMIYTRFVSAISFLPETVKLLPFSAPDSGEEKEPSAGIIYEPAPEEVLGHLLPQYLVTTVYAALLQAAASELSSRMNAMSNATDNAQELIATLDLYYNKVRQAGITREITEIVGGADALK